MGKSQFQNKEAKSRMKEPSSSLDSSPPLDLKMEERNTSGVFLSKDSNISTWESPITAPNESIYKVSSYCDIRFQAMISLYLIFALFGMAGNAMVLWLQGFHLHRNAFSVYILNLARADFLFLFFQFVFCLLFIIHFFFSTPIHSPLFFIVLAAFPYFCGLSILSAISIERCLSVMWSIWYHCQRPRHTSSSSVICAFLWALSLLLCFLHGDVCGVLFNSYDFFWCQTFHFIMASWSIALFVVLCGSSLTLLLRVFCGSHRIPVTRLYVILVLILLFFLIFVLPLRIYCLLYKWIGTLYHVKSCDISVTLFLPCINSSANPIIYFFDGSIRHCIFQRKTLKLFLRRALQDTAEEEEGGERGSSGEQQELETV
ncbi:LOW QUALITY PROTEIN: mas-related G-protein coupled receptor member B2-like [Mesocricetus auratus]|uniref:LOW QUALITY PROTEIN: mas-related G-protein coupled receptor member B2-like n=1 Tax=Mesocricetus auratus TaxID=10036 RepID=A0ABM2X5Q8_MESAU|nr:LOW QUALITY PROTEIN: mas-related G-protein coupled receptor member B2-like [Mesocricetus auratus]